MQGSDHCPVYAVIKDTIYIDGEQRDVKDVMNPPGMFLNGKRLREYSVTNDPLPLSGKLIPEFFGRRNIREMFARKPSVQQSQSTDATTTETEAIDADNMSNGGATTVPPFPLSTTAQVTLSAPGIPTSSPSVASKKRPMSEVSSNKPLKRAKSSSSASAPQATSRGQQSLKGFFKPKASSTATTDRIGEEPKTPEAKNTYSSSGLYVQPAMDFLEANDGAATPSKLASPSMNESASNDSTQETTHDIPSTRTSPSFTRSGSTQDQETVHDPIQSKESWSKLFTKPVAPRCEGHDEPCITLLTKKPGMNLGRSFWMCPRPLGPSGAKEKNTQWRCQTFIWCSDWNSSVANGD